MKMNISNFPNDCDQLNGFNINNDVEFSCLSHANLKISICPVGNVKCEVPTWSWHLGISVHSIIYLNANGDNDHNLRETFVLVSLNETCLPA